MKINIDKIKYITEKKNKKQTINLFDFDELLTIFIYLFIKTL